MNDIIIAHSYLKINIFLISINIFLIDIKNFAFVRCKVPAESLLRAISYSVFKWLMLRDRFQIFLRITVQYQIGIIQRRIVD